MTVTSTQPGSSPAAWHARGGRLSRWLRGQPADPVWARPALLALLIATGLLYLVGLSRNGWGNEFYAAAVQAGTKSWKAFLFGSLDSANFITVDKPPGFLWVMEVPARIFGLTYWSLLVPQALEGVAGVAVLYATVRRWFGPAAAIMAGAVLAVTPVATLIFRFDDPDALLTLMMTVAAYAATQAIESGRTRWLVLTGALLGVGFLAKMLAAFLVLPALALAYLYAGPPRFGTRIAQLLAGGAALLVTAGWWVAIDLLTPAASRPFVGSTTDNNILQLTFGYNGLSRLTGNGGPGGGAGGRPAGGGAATGGGAARAAAGHGFGGGAGAGTGLTRLFQPAMGGQISWLIPAALIALAVLLWLSRRAGRTDRTRAAAVLWGGWLLVAGLVLSFMSGISHSYYTLAIAAPIGALTGIGAARLWQLRHTWFARSTLAVTLLVSAAWAWVLLGRSPGWFPALRVIIVVAAVLAAALILAGPGARSWLRRPAVLAAVGVPLAVLAGLGGPLAYSLDTAASSYSGSNPVAGPALTGTGNFGRGQFARLGGAGRGRAGSAAASGGRGPGSGGPGNATLSRAFVRLLTTGAAGYTWAAATNGSDSAAAMELTSGGVPVMAIGGFRGTDPAPTLAEFERLVSRHEIHYFVAGGRGGFGGAGGAGGRNFAGLPGRRGGAGNSDAAQISAWVTAHFRPSTVGGETVYTL